jgi:hygromycin-B 4-O-kinase
VEVALIGEGAWSRCYGFHMGEEALVVRFGNFVEDFRKDQLAYAFNSSDLPVPEVREIGQVHGGYYAIATRAYGIPLEGVSPTEWETLAPSVAAALEAMRETALPPNAGVGGWGPDGVGSQRSWSEYLLGVGEGNPDRRTYGWRRKLAESPVGDEIFEWGYDLLKSLVGDEVPISLLHCDLINRNVLVDGGRITGVLDWGCSIYGDPLYDLAWFEFWEPWHPNLAVELLRYELVQRWEDAGYKPENQESRLHACHLHIGLDHLAYNAFLGDWAALEATAVRMKKLVGG